MAEQDDFIYETIAEKVEKEQAKKQFNKNLIQF